MTTNEKTLQEIRKNARQRRKLTEAKKKAQGLTLVSLYLNEADKAYLNQVKGELSLKQGNKATNEQSIAHIFNCCRSSQK